ncbi:thioredoxin [Enterococcus gilvus]|uniref:thioredoxin n=1 Tax=Enterococcus gilvus TaxID=160453 RepID=UPI003EDA0B33
MRRPIVLLLVPLFLGLVISGGVFDMKRTEKKREQVELSESAVKGKLLFFYRDDCRDCQKIFAQVYVHARLHQDVLFVNLNQAKKRRYIQTFDLRSVPTLVRGSTRVVGTKKAAIKKILEQ